MMRKIVILSICMLFSVVSIYSQYINYNNTARALYQSIQKNYYRPDINYYKEFPDSTDKHKVSFLWSMASLWQADNEMDAMTVNTGYTGKDKKIIDKYFDPAPPAPGYDSYPPEFGKEDRYYDDNQWLGLTAMDAWFRTNDTAYLHLGKSIYRFMMTGYDTVSGGGIYWREGDKSTKNTCSNGPGIVLALKLYMATKNKTYLDTAIILYNWANMHLQDKDGLYFDNIRLENGHIAKRKYSYNTGTMLQSNALLYRCTHKKKYLDEAVRISNAAKIYFLSKGKFTDGYWFNAVLLRGMIELFKINHDKQYLLAFRSCLDEALQNDMNEKGLAGKEKSQNLVAQGGLLEMLARFSNLYHEGLLN